MLCVDGIIFSLQRFGGISAYHANLLQVAGRRGFPFELSLEYPIVHELNDLERVANVVHRSARIFERYRHCRLRAKPSVFHSSYFRLPARSDIPSVVTVHDFLNERFSVGVRREVNTRHKFAAVRRARAVICVSHATRNDFLHFIGDIPGQSVHVIHHGVAEIFSPLRLSRNGKPSVLFVGKRRGYKNFRLAVSALEYLPDVELLCVGGGELRWSEVAHVSSAVRQRIRHLGYVSSVALNELYNRVACLVYPSAYEGFGMPILEAMRAGCPVVSLRQPSAVEVGGEGLIVAEGSDPRAIADAINVARSPERERVVALGIANARKYSWDATFDQTLDVYRSLGLTT